MMVVTCELTGGGAATGSAVPHASTSVRCENGLGVERMLMRMRSVMTPLEKLATLFTSVLPRTAATVVHAPSSHACTS